jgi:hypothetical protein
LSISLALFEEWNPRCCYFSKSVVAEIDTDARPIRHLQEAVLADCWVGDNPRKLSALVALQRFRWNSAKLSAEATTLLPAIGSFQARAHKSAARGNDHEMHAALVQSTVREPVLKLAAIRGLGALAFLVKRSRIS